MSLSDEQIRDILSRTRRIAVVGLSPKNWRPSHGVAGYLQEAGFEIVPVNPFARNILGVDAVGTLEEAAAAGPVDLVNVFRRSEAVTELVDSCVAVAPLLVWMQVGVVNQEAARRIESAGIPVVMDRCLAVEHMRMEPR